MDLDESIEAPAMIWFWPNRRVPDTSDTDEVSPRDGDEAETKNDSSSTDSEKDEDDKHSEPDLDQECEEYEVILH